MGKKTRIAGGTVGRRTKLQLSPPGNRGATSHLREEGGSGSEDEPESDGHKFIRDRNVNMNMKGPAIKATEGLSLLGAYEDSDDEDSDSQQTSKIHNQSADIDSTLANFMAEIDAITTQPNSEDASASPHPVVPSPTPPRPETNVQQGMHTKGQEQPNTEKDFQYNTQDSLAGVGVEMGDWQEVWDDNSGCYYYWSTVTNEVSWELPSYLAHQVQGLQHYSTSAPVNGNETVDATYYPANNTALAPTPAIKKEAKVKEVMESVVALTSAEEERHGVAASLLAPLIPPEVKVAEEKWRKRLLGNLEEGENGVDSDGEACVPAGSPSTPLRDPEGLGPAAPREPPAKVQSQESSDAEEEPEEDTVELELALERKKAELRALEEGDGSAGGSSPYSETSQEAPGSQAALKKSRWKTAFIRTASPDSNSRGSDTQEHVETVQLKSQEKPADENDEDKAEDQSVVKAPAKDVEVETPELRFQIGELANTLTSKMEFLGINKKAISNFQLLLLQTETRIADWREGALNGVYLCRRLQEAAQHIKHYELNATPKGWSCHWDREHRRYFYVNDRTSVSRWDFPTKEEVQDEPSADQTPGQGDASAPETACPPAPPPTPPPGCPPSQPPPPETPPPPADYPPPPPPPPGSPPPPPPPPDSDSEIMEVEMEMDDDDAEPPAPGTEDDGSGRPPPPPVTARVLDTSVSLGKGQKRKAGQLNRAITIGSSPILYTQNTVGAAAMTTSGAYWGVSTVCAPSLPAEVIAPPPPAPPVQPPLPLTQPPPEPSTAKAPQTDKNKKPKKDKSKKTKTKMPSLVKKWQSIQKELDDEDKSSSSDEDRDQLNKRTIEEWKQQMLLTGKSNKNANFEALPEDWRVRLKKRKKTNSM